MKRRLACLLILALLLVSASAASGATSVPIRVYVRGQPVPFPDQLPVIVDGRTLVPIRGTFEALGANVKWEPEALRVTVSWRGNQAAVFLGSRTAWVNGQKKTLDVAPRIIGNRTMVPLRFLAEALGELVRWEDRHNAVIVGEWPAMPVLAPNADPDMEMPCTLRVAMRKMGSKEPDPNGAIIEISEVDLAEYVADVLAQEFGDFPEGGKEHFFTEEPLQAGAVAVLMYVWYYAWHPTKASYDLDNSTRAQVYIPGKAREKHRKAVRAVWGTIMVRKGSQEVFAPQHGQGWYSKRSKGTDWMNQRGALYLSDKHGYSWDQILRYYYPNIELLRHSSPCAGLN